MIGTHPSVGSLSWGETAWPQPYEPCPSARLPPQPRLAAHQASHFQLQQPFTDPPRLQPQSLAQLLEGGAAPQGTQQCRLTLDQAFHASGGWGLASVKRPRPQAADQIGRIQQG